MNSPYLIVSESFQEAWANAIILLKDNGWNIWSLVVQITAPTLFNREKHDRVTEFSKHHEDIIEPDKVAYTIFPFRLYKSGLTKRKRLYKGYWRYFKMTRQMEHSSWGTYFERMIKYPTANGDVDQLGTIIDNINTRDKNYGASYVLIIPRPDKDLKKIMAAPCLNYITIQVEKKDDEKREINLLAVYRNHDFRARAYGNYYGLCKLLQYISFETGSDVGVLTCVSSHACTPNNKQELFQLAQDLIEIQ